VEGQLAEALVTAGAVAEGQALASEVLNSAMAWRRHEAARAMIAALVQQQDWEQLDSLLGGIAAMREADPLLDALAERAHGQVLAAAGDESGARASLSSALAAFQRFPHVFELARTREAQALMSDEAARASLLREAIASYQTLGAAPHLARAQELLGTG
jgi:hypothetical protein